LLGTELRILAVHVQEFVGGVGCYLQFEKRAVL
jgi:hypothetical protein